MVEGDGPPSNRPAKSPETKRRNAGPTLAGAPWPAHPVHPAPLGRSLRLGTPEHRGPALALRGGPRRGTAVRGAQTLRLPAALEMLDGYRITPVQCDPGGSAQAAAP